MGGFFISVCNNVQLGKVEPGKGIFTHPYSTPPFSEGECMKGPCWPIPAWMGGCSTPRMVLQKFLAFVAEKPLALCP